MSTAVILTPDEKKYLLALARNVISMAAEDREFYDPKFFSSTMQKKLGAFVTLHKHDQLRGCIGYIEGIQPLQTTIVEMAHSAAFKDPRFTPVGREEIPALEIEISVLSPIKEIKNVEEIEVGKHGLIIEKGLNKGLLLPQVATEYNWDRETFLCHTCIKAGLSSYEWQDDKTTIKTFTAEVFSEKDF